MPATLARAYAHGRTRFPILRMCKISWYPVESFKPSEMQHPGGPSIFGGFAPATGYQEIVCVPKMGKRNIRVRLDSRPGDAVLIAPVSGPKSLLTGNFKGKFAVLVDRRHDPSPETLHRSEVNSLLQLRDAFGRAGYREDITAKSVGNSDWLSLSALQSAVVPSGRPLSAQTVLSPGPRCQYRIGGVPMAFCSDATDRPANGL